MKILSFQAVILCFFSIICITTTQAQTASVCCPFNGWDYVVPITVTNNSAVAAPANLQTLLKINTQTPISQGKMQANGNDIRFVYNTCGSYLDYYIENGINTTITNIWVRMPVIPAGGSITIYMYYGNAGAPGSAVTFNNMFPNVLTVNAPSPLSGTVTYDWIDIQAGGVITMTAQQPLILQARKIIFNGSFNGANLGYLPAAGPGRGNTDNGGSCGGGGGGYGGAGGTGGCGAGAGGVAYGTPNGTDIDMGSGGGGSDCPANARGGGSLSLLGCDVVFNGTVNVSGQTITNLCCCNNSSEAAGGGAGGGVRVIADYVSGNATVNARGGNGQNSDDKEGGGGGGGGRVKVLWTMLNNFLGTANITGGTRGNGGQSGQQDGAAGTFTQPQIQGLAINYAAEVPVSIPLANFNFNNVCLNTLASFNDASTFAPQGSITQWAWDFGDGVGTSTQQSPTYTFTAANTYTVSLTVTTVSGCTDNTTAQIVVSGIPTADFNAQNVCVGFPSPFTNASSNDVTQWNWDFGDGNTSTDQNPTHSYASAGNYNVTLVVATAANCTGTIQKQVSVNASPNAAFNFSNVCLNTAASFTDASTSSVGNITNWQWNFGDGNTANTQSATNNYAASGTYDVELTVTANGCSNIATQAITIFDLPIAQGFADSVCAGEPSIFTDASTVQNGAITQWQWSFGDGNLSANQNPTHTYTTAGNYTATLTVTSDNECEATVDISVEVYAQPVADFNVTSVCLGLPAQFNDATVGGNIVDWSWSFGDGNTATAQNATNTYNAVGNYDVSLTVTTNSGCTNTIQKQLSVFENPEFGFTATAACFGESNGNAIATPTNGFAPYNYSWDNGQSSATANSLSAGDYAVTITDANGCTTSGTATVTQPAQPLVINATPDSFEIGFGDTVLFNITNNYYPEIQYAITPNYNISCTNCNSVSVFPNQTTTYVISAADTNGCSAEADVTVTVSEKYILYIPNAFSPNADGVNDDIRVFARGVKTFYWIIFNRWGEKVFESNDINEPWDGTYKGKLLNPDVYVYKVQLSYLTGKTAEQKVSISILK
jgi:gliding motility-associated-like protein